jgi:phosphatidylglycerophosphatase C
MPPQTPTAGPDRPPGTDVAAFDFDGTLCDGGSVFDFLTAVAGRPAVLRAVARLTPRMVHAALVGGTAADATKEALFDEVLAGTPVDRAESVAVEFAASHLTRHLRPTMRRRLDWHRGRGDRVVIVSASPELYVREAGRLLGVDDVIATGLAVDGEGRLTGRYQGLNCRGEEKLRRLEAWIHASGAQTGRLWAYGNSRGDLRMLRAADVGVNVGRLGRLGRLRSFPSLHDVIPPPPE